MMQTIPMTQPRMRRSDTHLSGSQVPHLNSYKENVYLDNNKMVLKETEWTSLYIPMLSSDLSYNGMMLNTEESLKQFIELLHIGKVSRIDFAVKELENGKPKKMAFIHFDEWYNSSTPFRETMDRCGEIKIYEKNGITLMGKNSNPRYSNQVNRFIVFKINKTPIQTIKEDDIPQNIHQLVNNNKLMEELIEEQKKKIDELEKKVLELSIEKPMYLHEIHSSYLIKNVNYLLYVYNKDEDGNLIKTEEKVEKFLGIKDIEDDEGDENSHFMFSTDNNDSIVQLISDIDVYNNYKIYLKHI